jgi:hypothetical protein
VRRAYRRRRIARAVLAARLTVVAGRIFATAAIKLMRDYAAALHAIRVVSSPATYLERWR